jgi:pyridoxal phosphate enzyme (YggS family)
MTRAAIAENLHQVQTRIAAAANRAGRQPDEITLVGVSKYASLPAMVAAYQAGLRVFGESRVAEVRKKIPALQAELGQAAVEQINWHMIGHLQSRKVPEVLPWAAVIHSVDSLKLAERLERIARRDEQGPVSIFLECNISGEASKYGFDVAGWADEADFSKRDAFFEGLTVLSQYNQLDILGLMTMAPHSEDTALTRSVFASLRQLQAVCASEFPQFSWGHLSMGMTNDFEIAIEEGATLVRVGRAIFSE